MQGAKTAHLVQKSRGKIRAFYYNNAKYIYIYLTTSIDRDTIFLELLTTFQLQWSQEKKYRITA